MSTHTDKVGIAIIGCGYWGVNYVRVFNQLPETYVAVICDARGERLAEIGKRFPDAHLTTNLSEALAHENVDAVVVCTGATRHYEVTKQCLEVGKPVLVEKPMTTSIPHATELIQISEARGVTLMVGHTFLYNGSVAKVKELIDQDAGNLYYLYSKRTNLGPIRYDVDALWDLAPHDVSIFNYFAKGMPRWVSAVSSHVLKNDRADVGFITLGYDNNVVGNIHVSWADPNKVRELVVVGSNQRIVFDDTRVLERVKVYEKGVAAKAEAQSFGEFQFQINEGDIYSPRIAASEPLKNQCKHFIHCVKTGSRPFTDMYAGLEVVQVMRAIDQSVAQNGAPVAVISDPVAASAPHNGYATPNFG